MLRVSIHKYVYVGIPAPSSSVIPLWVPLMFYLGAGLGTAIRSNHTANNYPLQKIAPQMALIAIVIYTNLLATHQRWGGKTEICNPCHRPDDWMSSQFRLVHYTSPRSGEESITTQITMPTSQFQNVRFKVLMETFLSSEEKNSVCNSCFML